jgi:hypothetical protein
VTITASSLVATETAAMKDQLWRPPALFLHDWTNGLVVRTSWVTDVAPVQSAGEVRSGLTPKPSRLIDVVYRAAAQIEAALLRSCLQRMAMARTPVPLFCDQSLLTAAASAAATRLTCDTADRRFFVGGRVAIWPATATTVATSFDMVLITAVDGTGLDVAAITNAYDAGAVVAPVIEADLVPQVSATYVTDAVLTAQLTFREAVGAATLDPILAVGSTPDGISSYDSLPILAAAADWSGSSAGGASTALVGGAFRANETSQVGLVNYTEVHGTRAQLSQGPAFLQLDREAAFGLLGFYDGRGGRQKPFWGVNLTNDFAATAAITSGATTVTLTATAPLLDWDWRKDGGGLAIVLEDDTVVIRSITSVSRAAGVDTVTLASALPAFTGGTAAVARISMAFRSRFGSDEVQEQWVSDTAVQVTLPQVEVVREQAYDLSNMPAAPVGGGVSAPVPGGGGASAGGTCYSKWTYNCETHSLQFVSTECHTSDPADYHGGAWFADGTTTPTIYVKGSVVSDCSDCERGIEPEPPSDELCESCTCEGPFGESPDQYCLDQGSTASIAIGAVSTDDCPDFSAYFPELFDGALSDILTINDIPFVSKVGTVWTWHSASIGAFGGGPTRYDATVTIDTSTSLGTIKLKSGPYQIVTYTFNEPLISGSPPGGSIAGGSLKLQNSSDSSDVCTFGADFGPSVTLSCCGTMGTDCV